MTFAERLAAVGAGGSRCIVPRHTSGFATQRPARRIRARGKEPTRHLITIRLYPYDNATRLEAFPKTFALQVCGWRGFSILAGLDRW